MWLWLSFWIGQIQNISIITERSIRKQQVNLHLDLLAPLIPIFHTHWFNQQPTKWLNCLFSVKERATLNVCVIYSFLTIYVIYSSSEWRSPSLTPAALTFGSLPSCCPDRVEGSWLAHGRRLTLPRQGRGSLFTIMLSRQEKAHS